MSDRDFLIEMQQVLTAQRTIIEAADCKVSEIESRFCASEGQAAALRELDGLMCEIEHSAEVMEAEDLAEWELEEAALCDLYEQRKARHDASLRSFQFKNWNQFVRDSQAYCLTQDIETVLPWEAMLSNEGLAQLKSESYEAKYRWDEWDYIVVGSAGVLAFLTDIFLVAIPKDMTSGEYKGQNGSIVTEKLRTFKFPPSVQTWLEAKSKVPYDYTGGGDHRIDTFGHDPVLGFIMGTIDIMRGGATTIRGGNIAFEAGLADPVHNPLAALVTQFLHMVSDVSTSKGLPVPFASVLRALKVGSFRGPGGNTHTVSQMILWMYHNGYDLRHFVTMGITPATIEIILRAYLMIRHYATYGEAKFVLAGDPKYRSMLLSAHAIACAGNAGKIALMQGNPLAINYAEWLALTRYLLPSLKYWVFDRKRLKMEHLTQINEEGWNVLLQASDNLLIKVYEDTTPIFELGAMQ